MKAKSTAAVPTRRARLGRGGLQLGVVHDGVHPPTMNRTRSAVKTHLA